MKDPCLSPSALSCYQSPLIFLDYDFFINANELGRVIEHFLFLCLCLCVLTSMSGHSLVFRELIPAPCILCFLLTFLISLGTFHYPCECRAGIRMYKTDTFWSWCMNVCMCVWTCMCKHMHLRVCEIHPLKPLDFPNRALPKCQTPLFRPPEGCTRGQAQGQSCLCSCLVLCFV